MLKNLAQKFKEEEDTTYTAEEKEYLKEEIQTMLNEIRSGLVVIKAKHPERNGGSVLRLLPTLLGRPPLRPVLSFAEAMLPPCSRRVAEYLRDLFRILSLFIALWIFITSS